MEWEFQIGIELEKNGIMDTINKDPSLLIRKVWKKNNGKARRVITQYIDSSQLLIVMKCITSKKITKIRSLYQ